MSSTVIYDELGPRGRRRAAVVSAVAGVVLALLAAYVVWRFAERGQLDRERWELFERWTTWRFLLGGLVNTLQVAAVAMVMAVTLGALLALGRLSRARPLRWAVGLWIEVFRAVPLLVFILFAFLGLPKYGIDISRYWALILALVVYNSAILAEIFRAGILSLDRGQGEAAYAVGMRYWQAMRLVVVPQAVRRMLPAIVGQGVTLLKDSSLGVIISYEELLRRGQIVGEEEGVPLQALMVAAVMFLLVNLALSRAAVRLEQRQARRYGRSPVTVEDPESGGGVGTPGPTFGGTR